MALKPRNRPSTDLSLASMSDIVFLLLIFFMLTSSFVQQGVKVDLPQASANKPSEGKYTVTVTTEGAYYWNDKKIKREEVERYVEAAAQKETAPLAITLRTDKEVIMEDAAFVMSHIAKHGGSVVIATKDK